MCKLKKMKILIIILFQIILTSHIYSQSLQVASKEEKEKMFLTSFSNQSTAPSYIVFSAISIKTNEVKEVCAKSIDLYFALLFENPKITNIDSLGATYANTRQITFKDTNALTQIDFNNYKSEKIIEIEDSLTISEKIKIAEYYNPDFQRKYYRIKKQYFKKIEKYRNKYFSKNIKLVTDSTTKRFLEEFKYYNIYIADIDNYYIDLNPKQKKELNSFQREWLSIKKIIDSDYYNDNPVEKYSYKYDIYFYHYLFNHGIIESDNCLGGLY